MFPYEIYGDPIIKKKMKYFGIKEHQLEYQECYSIAMETYIYSIHRCAFCEYSHFEYYNRKMIKLAILWGILLSRENIFICKENNLRLIELNAMEYDGV